MYDYETGSALWRMPRRWDRRGEWHTYHVGPGDVFGIVVMPPLGSPETTQKQWLVCFGKWHVL